MVVKGIVTLILILILLFFLFYKLTIRFSEKVVSPNGKYYAQVNESNGGATTGFVSSVYVSEINSILSYLQIIGVRLGDGRSVFGNNGPLESIQLNWEDDNSLHITYKNCSVEYQKEDTWNKVNISHSGECNPK